MNKYLYTFLLGLVALTVNAQERFTDPIFDDVTVHSDIIYSDVTDFHMNVYEPTGDTMTQRPLLVFAHGGAFIGGDPLTGTSVAFCTEFAKRGYVTASIRYQLGETLQLIDSLYMMDIVVKAVGDGKAAIRFFNEDAGTDNEYRVDTDKVFIGGNSAGGILAMHLAYLDEEDVLPEELNNIVEENGGLEGNRGNEGSPVDIKGVINLAGGLNVLSLIDSNSPPTFSAHGDEDGIVPYDCNDVYWGDEFIGLLDMVDICGSSTVHPILEDLGIANELFTVEGANHTPWSTGNIMLQNQIIQMAADFLAPLAETEEEVISSTGNNLTTGFALYPNPTTGLVNIDLGSFSNESIVNLNVYNLTGSLVKTKTINAVDNTMVDFSSLVKGAYLLQLSNENFTVQQTLIKL